MTRKQLAKVICDGVIIFISAYLALETWRKGNESDTIWLLIGIAAFCVSLAVIDIFYQCSQRARQSEMAITSEQTSQEKVHELILLDEHNKPIKSWNIAGKTGIVIGRKDQEEEVDVDLEDSEYGTFVDPLHASLNYCFDSWYLEDLGSANGVRVQKAEDGICYKMANRPCKIVAGDIIYIANMRILMT